MRFRVKVFASLVFVGLYCSRSAYSLSLSDIKELGFRLPEALIQNPRLRSISREKAEAIIAYLEQTWGFSSTFIRRHPVLVGHYLPELQTYWEGLSPMDRKDVLKMKPNDRMQIVLFVRAVTFKFPRDRIQEFSRKLRRTGCGDWLDLLKFDLSRVAGQ